ncbi:hypothetical protein LC613_33310 [Nostoc sphaeroides CHAB 2801]|uniref:hypothetical protein n=1 Tax=Nostoc sphaeroides TaxID=446679 RepID=UPI001E3DA911|nr:hypothetical protein [Nostoc sphaeroides]MCC5632498.1 hypothetical protein [Nostoc sphaeroides CHAB 2801]
MGWEVQHWVATSEAFNYLPQECKQMQLISDACGGLSLHIRGYWKTKTWKMP